MAKTVGIVDVQGRQAKAHILNQRKHISAGTKCDAVPADLKEKVDFQLKRMEQPGFFGVKAPAKPKSEVEKAAAAVARAQGRLIKVQSGSLAN